MVKVIQGYFILRPRWDEVPKANTVCTCGESLMELGALREHWQLGHFDRVINPGDDEWLRLTGQPVSGDGP